MNSFSRKNSLRSRSLQIETLENRELLSVNPLLDPAYNDDGRSDLVSAFAAPADNGSNTADIAVYNSLISRGVDGNSFTWDSNGRITEIYIYGDLTGTLDVRGLTNLEFLNCGRNQLTTLDVSGLTNLQYLFVDSNQLTTLDVSDCTALKQLGCEYNQLTTLDVSKCTDLEGLWCHGNGMQTLYLAKAPGEYNSEDEFSGAEFQTGNPGLKVFVNDVQIADAPANFSVTRGTANSVTLSWTAQANLTGYTLQYRKTGDWDDDWSTATAPAANAATATITDLAANTAYTFRILAKSSSGDSLWSYVSILPANADAGDVAVYNGLIERGADADDFTWENGRITRMYVYYKGLTGTLDVSALEYLEYLDCEENQLTALNVSGLKHLTTLYCWDNKLTTLDVSTLTNLEILDCEGNGMQTLYLAKAAGQYDDIYYQYGNPGIQVFVGTPPNAPTAQVASKTKDSVTLSWTAQANLTYTLEYRKSGETPWITVSADAINTVSADAINTATATISNLTENTAYEFRLTATNTAGSAAAVIKVTTKVADAAQQSKVPNDPQANLTDSKKTSSATITWKAATNDAADVKVTYVIEYTDTATGKTKKVTVSPKKADQTDFTKDLKLKAGTTYTFEVYAKGAKGVADSEAVSAGTITTYAVVPKAALATISAKKDTLPSDFQSDSMIAARVSNYLAGTHAIGTAKKSSVVDTVTITYTFGKTKADKETTNFNTATLTWNSTNSTWTSDKDNVSLKIVDGRAYIIIKGLTDATKYTLTAQFSNENGVKATSTAATSKTIATTKLNWNPVTGITSSASASSQSASVSWTAASDSTTTPADTVYTVKIWTLNAKTGQPKVKKTFTVKAGQYTVATNKTASWVLTASQAKIFANIDKYWVTVTPKADKLHIAGTETAPVASDSPFTVTA